MQKKCGQNNQDKADIAEGRSIVYLVMFIKLVFRQSNNVCIENLSFLIVKINSLAIF